MVLIAILVGTLVAGIGSVWLAALLSFGLLARYTQHMLSLAAGALLATAFMHLLPEAFESQTSAHSLFAALLVGLVFFFLLDKAELWHHGHEHHGHEHHGHAGLRAGRLPATAFSRQTDPVPLRTANSVRGELVDDGHGRSASVAVASAVHDHGPHGTHGTHEPHAGHHHGYGKASGGWAVLAGDSVHAFGDGILIASAFMADMQLGFVAALAVLVHEVPHHMGDLIVLRQTSNNRRAAFIKVTLAGAVTALGGIIGYALVDQLYAYLPFFLVIASSSFVYVALADLIPQLQRRLSAVETAAQIAWLLIGMALVMLVSTFAHAH
jgi:zinc and cadmium transporter